MRGLDPRIHVFLGMLEDADGRHKAGHDEERLVIPGRAHKRVYARLRRAMAREPGIQMQAQSLFLDSGFARHSASKTRVNALMARAPE
jgi:hypothetical protein